MKVRLKMEGRMRGEGWRDGVHFDSFWMGILREEWLAGQGCTMKDIFTGELVRLSAFDLRKLAKAYTNWTRDSELQRLFDAGAFSLHSQRPAMDFFEKLVKEENPANHFFSIRSWTITAAWRHQFGCHQRVGFA